MQNEVGLCHKFVEIWVIWVVSEWKGIPTDLKRFIVHILLSDFRFQS